jgi:ABC-type transporter Mla subunit MlaD
VSQQHRQLHETVTQLHAQLGSLGKLDPEVHRLLEQALDDILDVLAKRPSPEPQAAQGDEATLTARLSEASRHFQETHPNLSNTLTGLVEALQRMGI